MNLQTLPSPALVIAVACIVVPLIQLTKRIAPALGGWYALALNFTLSALGVVITTPPDQLYTVTTALAILQATGIASGIHGTSKLLRGDTAAEPAAIQSHPTQRPVAMVLLAAAMLGTLGLGGCTSWERQTYQTLAASKAVIDQAQADYEARGIPRTEAAFATITRAKAAQQTAVDAFKNYELAKAGGSASASATAQAQTVTAQALLALPALIADVKTLYGAAPAKVVPQSLIRIPHAGGMSDALMLPLWAELKHA